MYTFKATVVRVIDGDSLWLRVDVGFRMTYTDNFRLARINTPEIRTKDAAIKEKAYEAKARLEELAPQGAEVLIQTDKSGKYGRWIAELTVSHPTTGTQINVNNLLLEEGLATPYIS